MTGWDVDPALLRDFREAGRRLVDAGLVAASGGNLSARIPRDACAVTARGAWLEALSGADLCAVTLQGERIGGGAEPSSELALHLAVYRERPDAGAVLHLHPLHAVLLDAVGHEVRLITTDHAYYVRRVERVGFHPPGSEALAEAVAGAVARGVDCVLLAHHGCVVVGADLSDAVRRGANLEQAALVTYRALLIGERLPAGPTVTLQSDGGARWQPPPAPHRSGGDQAGPRGTPASPPGG